MIESEYKTVAESLRAPMVAFCQRLIQTPSLSGQEGEVARMVKAEMESLGYDQVWIDEVGNVVGLLRGSGSGRSVMLNCHLDHVDPGDPALWPHPPYSGEIVDGNIWGRGACDIKGPLAAQVYAGAALRRAGVSLRGDVYVVGAVMDEVGGLGSFKLAETVRTDCAVVGEPSSNRIARGHRGRVGVNVRVKGKSAHASAPGRAVNPHYVLARFLLRLENLPTASHPFLGPASAAPTLYTTDQKSANVIPSECLLQVDWRSLPGQTAEQITGELQAVLDECSAAVPGSTGVVEIPERTLVSYTGFRAVFPDVFRPLVLPEDHWLLAGAREALDSALGRDVEVIRWTFSTDGGHLMAAGIPTLGFGPGREDLTHTVQEHISIDSMVEGLVGNIALAARLAG